MIVFVLVTAIGGFFKIAFLSNIMFGVSLFAVAVLIMGLTIDDSTFAKKVINNTIPPKEGHTRRYYTYIALILLNLGFGYWFTFIFWCIALACNMCIWTRHREIYEKLYGSKNGDTSTGK